MIVTRTPFRVTLGGGGTDLPSFYEKHGGYILAMGIDKFMYVMLNVPHADKLVRLHYTQSETVSDAGDLKHELAREALKFHGIRDRIEIASLADLPAGTGLGSSSCYLVGLLQAIRAYLLKPATAEALAQEACRIELDILKKPIGKQDQYMAATGGITELHIGKDGAVRVERLVLPPHSVSELIATSHLYYTNVRRDTTEILAEQNSSMKKAASGAVEESLLNIKDIGLKIGRALRACDFDEYGRLMHQHWLCKQKLSSKISVSEVDALYDLVRKEFGVLGGKIVGAGGGGFLLLYAPARGRELTEFMRGRGMERLNYAAEFDGSRVVSNVMASHAIPHHRALRPILANE